MRSRYLGIDEILRIHIAEMGQNLLADQGLLESAVMRPQQTAFGQDAYPTLALKAAALLQSLIGNHPFIDGNKRTAVLSTIVFLNLNGFELNMDQQALVQLALDIASGKPKLEAIAAVLQNGMRAWPGWRS